MSGEGANALVGPLDADGAIKSRIFTIRGVQVILDWDIAQLYGVETRVLNQAVKRNLDRFPERFRFVLTKEEMLGLITNCDKFGSKRHYPGNEAYSFAKKLVGKATKSILLVDGYCDDVTLDVLSAKRGCVKVTIATVAKTPITETAIAKFNKQNPTLEVKHTGKFHDRFLVIDDKELYHFGASLKDLGRHYCAVSKMDAAFIPSIKQRM